MLGKLRHKQWQNLMYSCTDRLLFHNGIFQIDSEASLYTHNDDNSDNKAESMKQWHLQGSEYERALGHTN